MWKPGQIVTVKGNRYRVTRSKSKFGIIICEKVCGFFNENTPSSCIKQSLCLHPNQKLPDDCYLVRIKVYSKSSSKTGQ